MSLTALEDLLRRRIGLDVQSIGAASLHRAVEQRMTALRVADAGAYLHAVMASEEEFQELTESLVVPETWFFRHPEAFAELAAIGERRLGAGATFRVLSVPCSTGEEPYSIAITLVNRGLPADRFVIDAIDISTRNLAVAEHGVFGSNSFRTDSAPAAGHLQALRNGYKIDERVQRQVRFRQGNLLADESLPRGTYHAIFCRNLLIYFDAAAQQRALRTLERLLEVDGVLFVGPADGFAASTFGFGPYGRSGAFAYTKPEAVARVRREVPIVRPSKHPAQRRAIPPAPRGTRPVRGCPAPADPPLVVRAEAPSLEVARTLADSGRIDEAIEACRRHVEAGGASADAYCLLGLLADARSDRGAAVEWYRKALYLAPGHVEALAHLALLSAHQGDGERARLLNARAARAARHDGDCRAE